MEILEATVQDARALLKVAQKYESADDGDDGDGVGIDGELVASLATAIERAIAADTMQRNAIRDVSRFTDAQNKVLGKAILLIGKARNAAKGCYGTRDKQMMREFRVGAGRAQTVKGMIVDLAYMKDTAAKWMGGLARHGFRASDLAALDAAAEELKQVDSSQELSKKAKKNATSSRNESVRTLLQTVQKVRNTAKSVFMGRKDVLVEFTTIKRARPRRAARPEIVVEKSARVVTAV